MKTIICTLMLIATIIGVYCVHRQYLYKQQAHARYLKVKEEYEKYAGSPGYLKAKQKFEQELEAFKKANNIK